MQTSLYKWPPFWLWVSLLLNVILSAIYFFGSSDLLLKKGTYNIKVDTRKATVHDVIGGFQIKPVQSPESYSTCTSRTETLTVSASASASASASSASNYMITQKEHDDAQLMLADLQITLSSITDNTGPSDVSIARVFGVHDFFMASQQGFICYSNNREREATLKSAKDACAMNGFLTCFGQQNSHQLDKWMPYYSVDGEYLLSVTALNATIVSQLVTNWSRTRSSFVSSTLRLNFDDYNYDKQIKNLLCESRYRKHFYIDTSSTLNQALPTTLGVISFIFLVVSLFVTLCFYFYLGAALLAISIITSTARFVLLVYYSISFSDGLRNSSRGIKITDKGPYIGFLAAISFLYLISSFLLVIIILGQLRYKRRLEEFNRHEKRYFIYDIDPPKAPYPAGLLTRKKRRNGGDGCGDGYGGGDGGCGGGDGGGGGGDGGGGGGDGGS